MLRITTLENEYNVQIEKKSGKYCIDNRTFKNLTEVKEYLDLKIKNDSVIYEVKYKDYLRFKTIIINGKSIGINDCQFLEDLYGYINWQSIKNHHTVLSINVSESIILQNPNLFDNRQKTKMSEYQYLTRYGDKGNSKQAITRKEIKVLNLEDLISIYVYGISNGTKYDIQCIYKKKVKQEPQKLAPAQHKDIISKANNHIAFNSNKSTIYTYKGIDYQLSLKDNLIYLIVNNEECSNPIGQYNFLSIPSIEYHYRHNGGAINDKEKKMTLGKIKTYLNNKQYSSLYSYLSESKYIDSYKKIMVDNEIVELKIIYSNYSIATFNLVRLDKTYLKINLYPNYLDTVKQFIEFYSVQLDNIKTSLEFDIFRKEEELSKLEKIKDQKIKSIQSQCIADRKALKRGFMNYMSNYDNSDKLEHIVIGAGYKQERLRLIDLEKSKIKTIYNELSLKFDSLTNQINALNLRIEKLNKTIQNLEISNYKSAIKKLVDSAMNSDNNKRLNHLLGSEHQDTKKVYSINSKVQITTSDKQKAKVSLKQIEKFTKKFIRLLDQNILEINDKKYGFKYFKTRINRNDPNNPFVEKLEISKQKLDKKILANFDTFIFELCISNMNRLTSLPYIYPNKEDMKTWVKLNNFYLNKYGIEIVEIVEVTP